MKTISDILDYVESTNNIPEKYKLIDEFVTSFMKSYFSEMLEIEKMDMTSYEETGDFHNESLGMKKIVHKRYWSNQESFYIPSSQSAAPHHLWENVSDIKIFYTGDDNNPQFLFNYKYKSEFGWYDDNCFLLHIVNNELSIEHFFYS